MLAALFAVLTPFVSVEYGALENHYDAHIDPGVSCVIIVPSIFLQSLVQSV